jgi:hypothetical protein
MVSFGKSGIILYAVWAIIKNFHNALSMRKFQKEKKPHNALSVNILMSAMVSGKNI